MSSSAVHTAGPRRESAMSASTLFPPPAADELPMQGPRAIYLDKFVPLQVCADRPEYRPSRTRGGERHWISPNSAPKLAYWSGLACAAAEQQHYRYGVREVFHAFMIRFLPGVGMRHHFDNEFEGCILAATGHEPTARVVYSACCYLSHPDEYEGGEIVIDGESPMKPEMGSVIVMRGDVGHHVEPVTSGERYIVKATVVVPTAKRWEMGSDGCWKAATPTDPSNQGSS